MSISGSDFNDVGGHKFEAAIKYIAERGIVAGYPDGSYRPDQTMTRGEFAEALARVVRGGLDAPAAGLPAGLDFFVIFNLITQAATLLAMLGPASPVGTEVRSPVPIWLTFQGTRWDMRLVGTRVG